MQSVMKCGHTLPVFGRVPREGFARLWRTTLLARSSELYLLRRSLRKGVLSPSGQQSFSQRKAERILRRHEQNLCGFRCRSCVRNEMQHTAPAVQEVYKAPVPPQRSRAFHPFLAKACCTHVRTARKNFY